MSSVQPENKRIGLKRLYETNHDLNLSLRLIPALSLVPIEIVNAVFDLVVEETEKVSDKFDLEDNITEKLPAHLHRRRNHRNEFSRPSLSSKPLESFRRSSCWVNKDSKCCRRLASWRCNSLKETTHPFTPFWNNSNWMLPIKNSIY